MYCWLWPTLSGSCNNKNSQFYLHCMLQHYLRSSRVTNLFAVLTWHICMRICMTQPRETWLIISSREVRKTGRCQENMLCHQVCIPDCNQREQLEFSHGNCAQFHDEWCRLPSHSPPYILMAESTLQGFNQ